MSKNFIDTDRADLARFLRETIGADRYPFSPKVRRLKELLAKVDPTPAPSVTPYRRRGGRSGRASCSRRSGRDETYSL